MTTDINSTSPTPKHRWYRLPPGQLIIALLVVECLLWVLDRLKWLPWHKGYAVLTGVAVVCAAILLMLLWLGVALVFRWRWQFSFRSLLVLTVAVAVPCGWLAMEIEKARAQQVARTVLGRFPGHIGDEKALQPTTSTFVTWLRRPSAGEVRPKPRRWRARTTGARPRPAKR